METGIISSEATKSLFSSQTSLPKTRSLKMSQTSLPKSRSLKMCRTCMCPSDLRPLFPKADKYHNFVRALYLSTGLQIELNDGLPQSICRSCAKTVESVMHFRSQSHSTEKKLLQYFNFNKNTGFDGKPNVEEQITIVQEIESEDENKKAVVVETEKVYAEESNNCMERYSNINDEPDSPHDSFPSQSDEDEDALIARKTSATKPYLDLIEGPKDIRKRPITCKICKKSSKTINAFEKHAMSHMGYEILCEFCARRCVSNIQLLRHQRAKHGLARDNSFACSYCDFQALDKEQLESHERRVHTKERPFVCDECGEAFYTKRVLIQHGYCHKTEKPFEDCLVRMPFDRTLFRSPEDCSMCRDVTDVVRLHNVSGVEFERQFAYSTTPVIVDDAMDEWRASEEFRFEFFKNFYKNGKLGRRTNDCFFFSYKSGFDSLSEVFDMDPLRANLTAGTAAWYVGWNTCYDEETRQLREYYSRPYFLPESAESDVVDWIFMGGPGQGAHMHVDSVRHMSWQAQVSGQKEWTLAPPPECLYVCTWITFTVREGEILVVDTNRWYHKTNVLPGKISITIGAEYD